MKIFLISIFLLLLAFIGFGCITQGKFEMTDSLKNTEIDKAIDQIKSEKHKKFLKDFKNKYLQAESILVTSHHRDFEIIVTNRSTDEYTGGAEQYFLDKKSGEIKMGWHEAPMKLLNE